MVLYFRSELEGGTRLKQLSHMCDTEAVLKFFINLEENTVPALVFRRKP